MYFIVIAASSETNVRTPAEIASSYSDVESFSRLVCGALLLPTIAATTGKIFFSSVTSNFQRTLLVSHSLVLQQPKHATTVFLNYMHQFTYSLLFTRYWSVCTPWDIMCELQGGIAFVAVKGIAKLYFKQQQYLRQARRTIRNFDEQTANATEL